MTWTLRYTSPNLTKTNNNQAYRDFYKDLCTSVLPTHCGWTCTDASTGEDDIYYMSRSTTDGHGNSINWAFAIQLEDAANQGRLSQYSLPNGVQDINTSNGAVKTFYSSAGLLVFDQIQVWTSDATGGFVARAKSVEDEGLIIFHAPDSWWNLDSSWNWFGTTDFTSWVNTEFSCTLSLSNTRNATAYTSNFGTGFTTINPLIIGHNAQPMLTNQIIFHTETSSSYNTDEMDLYQSPSSYYKFLHSPIATVSDEAMVGSISGAQARWSNKNSVCTYNGDYYIKLGDTSAIYLNTGTVDPRVAV